MAKKDKERDITRSPKFDPTIPRVAVEIEGQAIELCFDFRALATAKAKLRALGVEVNILQSVGFGKIDFDTLPAVFYAAAQRYQPEFEYSRAVELVNIRTYQGVFAAIAQAYMEATRPDETENPTLADETPTDAL